MSMTTKAIINGPVVAKKKLELLQQHTGEVFNILAMPHTVISTPVNDGVQMFELAIGNARVLFTENELSTIGDEQSVLDHLLRALNEGTIDLGLVAPEGTEPPSVHPTYVEQQQSASLANFGIVLGGGANQVIATDAGAMAWVPPVPPQAPQMSLEDIVRQQLGVPRQPSPAEVEAAVRAQLQGGVLPSTPAPAQASASSAILGQMMADPSVVGVPRPAESASAPRPLQTFTLTMSVIEPMVEVIQAASLEEAQAIAEQKRQTQLSVFNSLGKPVQIEVDVTAIRPFGAQHQVSATEISGGTIASVPTSTEPMDEPADDEPF